MQQVFGIENPRVALINNGAEKTKGTEIYRAAHELLCQTQEINFIGNIEGRDIVNNVCDVLVADGFTGNIILKMAEGFGGFMSSTVKELFAKNLKTKLGALLVKDRIQELKKRMDHREYGGAPLLGVAKPVIKAHGSSDTKAMKFAVLQAINFTKTGVCNRILELNEQIIGQKL